jgi:hypothetical protein
MQTELAERFAAIFPDLPEEVTLTAFKCDDFFIPQHILMHIL